MINTLILFPHTVSFQDIPVKHFEVSQAHEAIRSLFVEKKKRKKKSALHVSFLVVHLTDL